MNNPPLDIPFDPALSLVREECRKATENGYLEPYYEIKSAALSLARQLIELQNSEPSLTHSQICILSTRFHHTNSTAISDYTAINEWLKWQIERRA
jgi:hypothetical protein